MKIHLSIILSLVCAVFAFGQGNRETMLPKPSPLSLGVEELQADRQKAIDLYRNSNFRAAIPLFESVLTADKADREAWFYLGMSLAKTARINEATEIFKRSFDLPPSNSPTHYDRELKIISRPPASYSDEAHRDKTTGTIAIVVEFLADGTIGTVVPLNTLPDGLTESCIKASKKIKFKPAYIRERPMTVIKLITYDFSFGN